MADAITYRARHPYLSDQLSQEVVDSDSTEHIKSLAEASKPEIHSLSEDAFGSVFLLHLVAKLQSLGLRVEILDLFFLLINNSQKFMFAIALHRSGCRTAFFILNLLPDMKDMFLTSLKGIIVESFKISDDLKPLIAHIITTFTPQDLQPVFLEVSQQLEPICCSQFGLKNLTTLLKLGTSDLLCLLINNLSTNEILQLTKNTKCCTFFQRIFSNPQAAVGSSLFYKLTGNFLFISESFYGHFIAESLCDHASSGVFEAFSMEILMHFKDLVVHKHGNHVMQRLLRRTKRERHVTLHSDFKEYLSSNRVQLLARQYGRSVVIAFERLYPGEAGGSRPENI